MAEKCWRDLLQAEGAPFDDAALNAMTDSEAVHWLERHSDDPLLFHGGRDKNGDPAFFTKRDPAPEDDPFLWYSDMEETYIACRLISASATETALMFGLVLLLAQQTMEKGG
jgi:hypothetical protein